MKINPQVFNPQDQSLVPIFDWVVSRLRRIREEDSFHFAQSYECSSSKGYENIAKVARANQIRYEPLKN